MPAEVYKTGMRLRDDFDGLEGRLSDGATCTPPSRTSNRGLDGRGKGKTHHEENLFLHEHL